jgi:hypothetical protein
MEGERERWFHEQVDAIAESVSLKGKRYKMDLRPKVCEMGALSDIHGEIWRRRLVCQGLSRKKHTRLEIEWIGLSKRPGGEMEQQLMATQPAKAKIWSMTRYYPFNFDECTGRALFFCFCFEAGLGNQWITWMGVCVERRLERSQY